MFRKLGKGFTINGCPGDKSLTAEDHGEPVVGARGVAIAGHQPDDGHQAHGGNKQLVHPGYRPCNHNVSTNGWY